MNAQWPQWTTELAARFVTGEDQLGVEGAAQGYQQYLVPGIITTTDHARYYSFYAWVLYRFIEWPDSSRLLKDLRGPFFKRHEVALDLVQGAGGQFQRSMLRPALYLGEYAPGLLYQPSEGLSHWAACWKTVEIRHLYTFGLQCLWAAFLLHLSEQQGSLLYDDYMAWVRTQLAEGLYETSVGDYLDEFVSAAGLTGGWSAASGAFDHACRQATQRDEYSLYLQAMANARNAGRLLDLGLEILAKLFVRFLPRHREGASSWRELANRALSHTYRRKIGTLDSPISVRVCWPGPVAGSSTCARKNQAC